MTALKSWHLGNLKILLPSILISFLLLALTASVAYSNGVTIRPPSPVEEEEQRHMTTFEGSGSTTLQITNPDECSRTGRCEIEMQSDFAGFRADEGVSGSMSFSFVDERSPLSSPSQGCSTPSSDEQYSTWMISDIDRMFLTQTLGFMCPSDDGNTGYWKRFLRIDGGTGMFDGITGSVFMSGRTVLRTGETDWSFSGSIVTHDTPRRQGCYRAYLFGELIMIPIKGMPTPDSSGTMFWLCGEDISLGGPNPRQDYEIFNPLNP